LCWSKVRKLVNVAVAQHDAERRRQVAQCATRPTRLAELRYGDVLFIDEIHAIPNQVAVFLYEAMQSRNGNPLGVQRVAGLLGMPGAWRPDS